LITTRFLKGDHIKNKGGFKRLQVVLYLALGLIRTSAHATFG